MIKEELKEIIGLVFIKGKENNEDATSKTTLAEKIVKSNKFKTTLSSRLLLDYHRYFFCKGKKYTIPNENTIEGLLEYLNFQSLKQFRENKPPNKDYPDNVPFAEYNETDMEAESEEEKSKTTTINVLTSNTSFKSFLFAGLCLVVILIIALKINKENNLPKNPEPLSPITINTEHFIVSDLNKIIPNENTQFFDTNNQPQVWYASNNEQLDFYNIVGIHPITNKQLQPISKEIIETLFIEREKETNQPNVKKERSLFNTSIINTTNNKEISLFIFDSINKIDNSFSNRLKQELTLKEYKVTPNLIIPSKLNFETIEHLNAGNIDYFNNEIKNYTDFICTGKISYSFSKNTILENRITCRIQIDYLIISSKTGEIVDSYSDLVYGNGLSKISAKNNTIKKFKL